MDLEDVFKIASATPDNQKAYETLKALTAESNLSDISYALEECAAPKILPSDQWRAFTRFVTLLLVKEGF